MKKLLVAEDDDLTREAVARLFAAEGWKVVPLRTGSDVATTILREKPDVLLMDVQMPGMSGLQICRNLRGMAETCNLPILLMTVLSQIPDRVEGLSVGADDYIIKPFDMQELKARVEAAYRRSRQRLHANPLTHLPGNPRIEEEAALRLARQAPFTFALADIDHFKSFNDKYGYRQGDQAIKGLGEILQAAVLEKGGPSDFVGHIGGDDFALILSQPTAEDVLGEACRRFDRLVSELYAPQDFQAGFITTHDRRGQETRFPLLSLSIGAASTQSRDIPHYAKLVEIANEMKRFAKTQAARQGSLYLFDKRKG